MKKRAKKDVTTQKVKRDTLVQLKELKIAELGDSFDDVLNKLINNWRPAKRKEL